jgi:hypothetical protein
MPPFCPVLVTLGPMNRNLLVGAAGDEQVQGVNTNLCKLNINAARGDAQISALSS